jgi:CHAT domain-containing protein/tetratricopeptide (TPR) repeat protein
MEGDSSGEYDYGASVNRVLTFRMAVNSTAEVHFQVECRQRQATFAFFEMFSNPLHPALRLIAGWCYFILLLIPACGQTIAPVQTTSGSDELLPGVVVENVEKNSEAEKAGLREGDVLLRWSRGEAQGSIDTPVDFFWVQMEQAPRGPVKLEGLRGAKRRSWMVRAETWGVTTRLDFSPRLLAEYLEAKNLLRAGKAEESFKKWYNTALQLSDPSTRSSLFLSAAYLFTGDSQWEQADAALRQALVSAAGDRRLELFIYWYWAKAWAQRDLPRSVQLCEEAIRRTEQPIATNLTNAALLRQCTFTAYSKGDLDSAENYANSALAAWERFAPMSDGSLGNLLTLGNLLFLRGDLAKSEDYYREGLRRRTKSSGLFLSAGLIGGLGLVAYNRGNWLSAESYYQQALAIYEKQHRNFSDYYELIYNNLGLVAEARGDTGLAEKYVQKALQLEKEHPNGFYFLNTISRLGNLRRHQGDLVQAKKYLQQAAAVRAKVLPGSLDLAWSFSDLGDVAHDSGDIATAEGYYRQALAIRERLAPGSTDHADTLAALARIMQNKKQLSDAEGLYEKASAALESQTARLGGTENARLGFRASHENLYSDYIGLLIFRNNASLAFSVLERSRARSLLEVLSTAHIDIRNGAQPALIDRERSLSADIRAKSDRHIHLMSEKRSEDETLIALKKEIADLLAQYQDVEAQIRVSSPTYAALTQPQPLTAKEVQTQLLDAGTLLLEYSLGEERSHVFAVTPDSLQVFELPKKSVLEKCSRHVYSLLTARNATVKGETGAQKQTRIVRAEAEYSHAVVELSHLILGPVASQLQSKRLLIVTDGALSYIPFSVLPEPLNTNAAVSATATPLMFNHEIVNLPSASVLAVLRQQELGRRPAPKAVAVLADPVFDRYDSRLAFTRAPAEARNGLQNRSFRTPVSTDSLLDPLSSIGLLTRSAADVGLTRNGQLHLPRLRFSRREADEIMAVTPEGEGKEAVDFEASRATATSPELSQYRIVHFATHGLLDSAHPELSGLVFSMVDKNGRPQNGFLELQDIYNLNLPADLVVLSACETGLGKEISGEGLVGLTRGFMYAGASRVMASLWKVSDAGTAALMGNFYRAMETDGLPPAAALRAAQIKMWQTKRWRDPYYWAAFQLQGEWK